MYQGISLDQAPPLFVPLRFFLSAPLFVVLGGIELLWFGSDLIGAAYAEPAIAWIHLWTLGWLAMVMFGAYYQMIPVMIGGQVPAPYLSGWVHGLLALGVLLFQGYFLFPEFSPFWLAGISLGLSIGLFIGQIAWALVRVKGENRPTLSAMRLSLVCLGITWFLGLWLLAGHGGWGPEIHGVNRDLHLSFALFGWVGFLIIGVSLHLVPMFYITPPFDKLVAQRVLRLLSITLVLLTFIQLTGIEAWLWVPVAFGFSGFGLYLFELTKILNRRRRKKVDPAARLLYLAIAWGWVALGLFVLGLWGKDLALKEGAVLIFSRTKHGARKICNAVRDMGHRAAEIHSNRSLGQRRNALEGFKRGVYRVLVATDIASRGIDVVGIELVINFDIPDDPGDYVHRIGRTGRAGAAGRAISFATPDQRNAVRDIERLLKTFIKVSKLPELPALPRPSPGEAPHESRYPRTPSYPHSFGRRPHARGGERRYFHR